MAKAKKKSVLGFVLFGLVAVALVLVIVGMFVGQVVGTVSSQIAGKSESTVYNLFDSDVWGVKEVGDKTVGVSNVFAIVSFIVTLVGLALLVVDGILRLFLNKNCVFCRIIGAALTLIGAILILVAGLVMANQCKESLGVDLGNLAQNTYSAGAGVWLGFVGGLVGAVAGALPISKKFA